MTCQCCPLFIERPSSTDAQLLGIRSFAELAWLGSEILKMGRISGSCLQTCGHLSRLLQWNARVRVAAFKTAWPQVLVNLAAREEMTGPLGWLITRTTNLDFSAFFTDLEPQGWIPSALI